MTSCRVQVRTTLVGLKYKKKENIIFFQFLLNVFLNKNVEMRLKK